MQNEFEFFKKAAGRKTDSIIEDRYTFLRQHFWDRKCVEI